MAVGKFLDPFQVVQDDYGQVASHSVNPASRKRPLHIIPHPWAGSPPCQEEHLPGRWMTFNPFSSSLEHTSWLWINCPGCYTGPVSVTKACLGKPEGPVLRRRSR
jgi:hypothetical protein